MLTLFPKRNAMWLGGNVQSVGFRSAKARAFAEQKPTLVDAPILRPQSFESPSRLSACEVVGFCTRRFEPIVYFPQGRSLIVTAF